MFELWSCCNDIEIRSASRLTSRGQRYSRGHRLTRGDLVPTARIQHSIDIQLQNQHVVLWSLKVFDTQHRSFCAAAEAFKLGMSVHCISRPCTAHQTCVSRRQSWWLLRHAIWLDLSFLGPQGPYRARACRRMRPSMGTSASRKLLSWRWLVQKPFFANHLTSIYFAQTSATRRLSITW